MTTKETIYGKQVTIDWSFTAPVEDHDNNWCEWMVTGTDEQGSLYTGTCHADATQPEFDHDIEISNIELI